MTEAAPQAGARMRIDLTWGWTSAARRLMVLAGMALAGALAFERPALVVLAGAPLAWLALAAQRVEPPTVTVHLTHPERCLEQEPITVTVRVELDAPVQTLRVGFAPADGFRPSGPLRPSIGAGVSRAQLSATLAAARWGSTSVGQVSVEAWTRRRLRQASAVLQAQTEVAVFPRPTELDRLPVGSTRYDRVGDHPAAVAGAGVEFHGVRRFVAGDQARRINWSASTRRGALYVNDVRAERAVDVIVAVDVLTDTGPAGHSSRDLALRGATGIAQTVLRAHDRVGLVAVGGRLQWLKPDLGQRQFYRIAEAMLEVVDWQSYVDPDVDRIPYPALPAGAHILFFTPLLDERGIGAVVTLRRRGHPVTVIDVCTSEPGASGALPELARRLWRLERVATRNRLANLGITVLAWDGTTALGPLITPAVRATDRVPR